MGRKRFTLTELLVVIAIIALLASLLLPALNNARDKGKQSSCLSNLKQQGLAINMYCNDYESYYPMLCDSAYKNSWDTLLSAYNGSSGYSNGQRSLNNWKLFRCPAGPDLSGTTRLRTYSILRGFNKLTGLSDIGFSVKTNRVRRPGGVICVTEFPSTTNCFCNQSDAGVVFVDTQMFGRYAVYNTASLRIFPKDLCLHGNHRQANYLFCDGRAAGMSPLKTFPEGMVLNARDSYGSWNRNYGYQLKP